MLAVEWCGGRVGFGGKLAVADKWWWRLSGGGGGGEGGGEGDLSAVAVARAVELQWVGGGAAFEWRWWSSGGCQSIGGGGWWRGQGCWR